MSSKNRRIPTTTFNNGIEMPMIGLGTYLSSPGADTENSVRWALDAGYRKIDTASFYENEASVGKALKESGVSREEVFITTKLWNSEQGYDNALQAFDRSREKLGLDTVDLYLIHWPIKELFQESWKAMEKLYADGKVRAIGLSNFEPHHIDRLLEEAEVHPVLNQVELHPYLNQKAIREYGGKKNIVTEAWSPLATGKVVNDGLIQSIAQTHGKTPAQVTLRWEHQHGVVVIPKSVHKERVEENFNIFDFTLSENEMGRIDTLHSDGRIGPHPDALGGW